MEDLFKDRKQFKSQRKLFERMVKKTEVRQKQILEELQTLVMAIRPLL
jgi:hypothetical protein